jgi:putative exosortase-associated protein (TIGR04073 family)
MLRKKQTFFLTAVAILLFSVTSHAEDSGISYPAKIGGKFGIGLINATTGIVEIPKTMMVMSESDGLGMGLSVGFLKGMGNMMGRTFLGMVDVISFPVPTKPLINPPVVFQDFGVETTYGNGWETY